MNRLHPLSAVVLAVNSAIVGLSLAFVATIGLGFLLDAGGFSWMLVLGPLGLLAGAAYGIAYYYRFGYENTPDTFDVSSGVISRRAREIPYRRIQNVDVRQGIIQRLLGLAVVSIETAGGGDTEASLNFVDLPEANRLQREIRERTAVAKSGRTRRTGSNRVRADTSTAVPRTHVDTPGTQSAIDTGVGREELQRDPESAGTATENADLGEHSLDGTTDEAADPVGSSSASDGEPSTMGRTIPLFHLRAKELLLYSFTSFRPAAAAAVLFFVFLAADSVAEYLISVSQPVGGPQNIEEGTTFSYGVLTIVSAIHAIAITYLFSVAYTFATYYDFRLGRVSEDFVYERGLLQRYSGSIPAEKVQSVTVTDNPAQRLIGYAGMWIETAGYGPESSSGSQSAVPLALNSRVFTFTERLTGVETPRFERPPPMARRRYLARYSIIGLVIVAGVFGLSTVTAFDAWYLATVVFAVVPPAAHLRYVNLGYYVGDEHIVIRRGFWRRRTTVIPFYRIQTVNVRRSIFQRRLGLASLVVDTASSRTFFWATPTVYDLDLEDARIAREESRDRLQTALRERAAADDVGLSVDFT